MTTDTTDDADIDYRDPRLRLRTLFDKGTLRVLAGPDDSGVVTARGEVDGTPVIAYRHRRDADGRCDGHRRVPARRRRHRPGRA